MYKQDHIKVLKVLASEAPKRPTFTTKDIVEKAFKRAENGDRRVRNAYRKIRKEGHAEIADRGTYRLTQSGVSFCAKADEAGWKFPKEDKPKKATKKARATKRAASKGTKKKVAKKAASKKATKKAAPKKAARKSAKKAARKSAKKAAAKKSTTKKAAAKKASTKTTKRAAKKPTGESKKASGKNGVSKGNTVPKDASAGAQLAF